MDLQTKQNVASIAAGVIVVAGLAGFVFLSNQTYNKEDVIKEEQEIMEVKSLPIPTEETYVIGGYIVTNKANIMNEPNDNSDVIGTLTFNDMIVYSVYDADWLKVEYNGQEGYVHSKCISNEEAKYESFMVERTSGFKSFMDYRTITDKTSPQYKLQKQYAKTNEQGIRMVNGRFCVALGSHFTSKIGQYVDLVLADGNFIRCVLADQKADVHTDSDNIVTNHNGCMSEFVVDVRKLDSEVKAYGDISHSEYGWVDSVVQVRVYDKNVFDEE